MYDCYVRSVWIYDIIKGLRMKLYWYNFMEGTIAILHDDGYLEFYCPIYEKWKKTIYVRPTVEFTLLGEL